MFILFRFYDVNAAFVHCGVEGDMDSDVICGVQDIKEKIINLHAQTSLVELSTVDAIARSDTSVLIEVSRNCYRDSVIRLRWATNGANGLVRLASHHC